MLAAAALGGLRAAEDVFPSRALEGKGGLFFDCVHQRSGIKDRIWS